MFSFLTQTFLLGLKNLRLHKLRSTLTALGIIIGVLAFIIMVAIGEGTKQAALEQLNQLGARNILVRSVPPPMNTDASARTQRMLDYGIKRSDVEALEALDGFSAIVPMRDTEQKVRHDDRLAMANAIGTTSRIFEVIRLHPERGRCFTAAEEETPTPAAVCVLGAQVAEQLFPNEDPLGQHIQVGGLNSAGVTLTVIGVLERTGLRPGNAIIKRVIDQDVYFPLRLAQDVFHDSVTKRSSGSMERKRIEVTDVWLQVREDKNVEKLAGVVESTVKAMHRDSLDFEVRAPIEILRAAEEANRRFNFIMGGIAGFSLIVGGIGIMNIMLASVTERTREIGIRRALGAKRRHIILQFLIETMVISLCGGLAGIVLGCGGAKGLPLLVTALSKAGQTYPTQVAAWSVIASFFFSGVIGIGFGLYPAITAARMNPIEALRHE